MSQDFFNAEEAAAELTRRNPNKPWSAGQVLRAAKAGRLPVCFDFDGELIINSVDGQVELAGKMPSCLDFVGIVRSLTPPTKDGLCSFGTLVEIHEAHGVKFSHRNGVVSRGIQLPTEFSHGGHIKVGHKVVCMLEAVDVSPDDFLFHLDDLARLAPAAANTGGLDGAKEVDRPATQYRIMKRKALIDALMHEWPSIEADLSEASRNGLHVAAHADGHGKWNADAAREWARSNGKLKKALLGGNAPWIGPTTRHKTPP